MSPRVQRQVQKKQPRIELVPSSSKKEEDKKDATTPDVEKDKATVGTDEETKKKNDALKTIDAKKPAAKKAQAIIPSKRPREGTLRGSDLASQRAAIEQNVPAETPAQDNTPKPIIPEISPLRQMELDTFRSQQKWPADVMRRTPDINTAQTVAALKGQSSLGPLTDAEKRKVMDGALSEMIDTKIDSDKPTRNYVAMRSLRDEAMKDPELAPIVSQAYADRAASMLTEFKNGKPSFPDDRALASTLATESMLSAGTTKERAALLNRLGTDKAALLSNAMVPKDTDTIDGNNGLLGTSSPFDLKNLAQGQLLTAAAANKLYGNDPAKLESEGKRLDAILNTSQGQKMLANHNLTLDQKYVNAGLILAHPEWDTAFMSKTTSPFDNPEIAQALAAPEAKAYAEQRGDAPQILSGTNLDNTIGFSLGFPPVVPENETPEARDAREKAVAEGRYSYYSSGPAAEVVKPIADSIRALGGDDAKVTVIPVQYASNETGAVQLKLYRVADQTTQQDRFVDNEGRTYTSFEDWRQNNRLPPGSMTYPTGGHLTRDAKLETAATPKTVDTAGEHVVQALDYAALVGGTIAGGAMIIGSGGALAPVVAGGAAAWGAYRNIESLNDRYQHGQSTNPIQSSEARAEWLGLGANVLGFASVGSIVSAGRAVQAGSRFAPALTTGASALTVGANVLDTASAVDNALRLISSWDQLGGAERANLALSLGFWGTNMVGRTKLAGSSASEIYSYRTIRDGILNARTNLTNIPDRPGRVFDSFAPARAAAETQVPLKNNEIATNYLRNKFPGEEGAKSYWGAGEGAAIWKTLGKDVPELQAAVHVDPTIAPWVKHPAFAEAVGELRAAGKLTPEALSKRLGEKLGDVTVYRALRLDAAGHADVEVNGLRPGAQRFELADTAETFDGMREGRLQDPYAPGAVPESQSLFNSISHYPDLAAAVATQDATLQAGQKIYLLKMTVPRNQIVELGQASALDYPKGGWRYNNRSGLGLYVGDRVTGEGAHYPVDAKLESFLFGSVPRAKIGDIQVIDPQRFLWERE